MLTRDMIPFGRENAVSRKDLMQMTGLSDRDNREVIAKMRTDAEAEDVIVSTSHHGGYHRTTDEAEIDHFIREIDSRKQKLDAAKRAAISVRERIKRRKEYGEGLV